MPFIEPPQEFTGPGPALFLAGGITGCPDWQRAAAHRLSASGCPVTVLNPRRSTPVTDPAEQIAWEHRHLHRADVILFWFAASPSPQPIALYELGVHATRGARLAVGADPAYSRRLDVVEQLRLARPEVAVQDSLEATVGVGAELVRGL